MLIIAAQGCKKSIDPGNWDILPPPVVEEPEPEPVEQKTMVLKVMSYNSRLSKPEDLTTMIEYIKEYNPDFLILRQIDSETTRANKVDRPKEVAQATGMNYFFAKAFDYQGGGYGNAVLSKYPIEETLLLQLSGVTSTPEVRSLAMATVKIDEFNKVVIAGTELDAAAGDEQHRLKQVNEILSVTKDISYPVIFGGNFNFNTLPSGQVYNSISAQFTFGCYGTGCPLNTPKASPTGIYDFITYKAADKRITVNNYGTFAQSTSNFLPIVAELKLVLLEK